MPNDNKIIILKGLPASGKSTEANKLCSHNNYTETFRVNKDLLRTMLHFDNFNYENERVVGLVEMKIAEYLTELQYNVVVDDTNINDNTYKRWVDKAKQLSNNVIVKQIDTDISECVKRDEYREKKVGAHVIYGMAMENGLKIFEKDSVVICDLDGTLCNIEHRRHFVMGEKKDWHKFFEWMVNDTVNENVLNMLREHHKNGKTIFFVSGRPETYRKLTEEWLFNNHCNYGKALFMRGAKDKRPDTEVKQKILDKYFKNEYQVDIIHEVIDDRPSVVRMWQVNGLKVVDVGDGVEF